MLEEYLNHSIIVAHACGDGANFLINALAMSDEIYFRNLNKENKIDYFFSEVDKQEETWSDVNMWTTLIDPNQKYLDHFIEYFQQYYPPNSKDFLIKLHYPYSFDESGMNDLKFMNYCLLKKKYLIVFENSKLFACLRHFFDDGVSKTCKYDFSYDELFYDQDLPMNDFLNNLTIKEYSLLPEKTKDQIKEEYEFKFSNVLLFMNSLLVGDYQNLQHSNSFQREHSFIWNTDWFLNEDDTASNIKKLYQNLGFDDYDEELIRSMYKVWIQKLDEIKIKYRNLK